MFLQASVCPQGGWGRLPQCMLGYHPSGADTPPGSRHPPGSRPPGSRHPPGGQPLQEQTPPRTDTPQEQTPRREQTPPRSRHPSARYGHCCGRYASYWNAFLFHMILCGLCCGTFHRLSAEVYVIAIAIF